MATDNIHEAKPQLSELAEQVGKGESFVVAEAGKPLVKVTSSTAPPTPRRLGFLEGEITFPKDFGRTDEDEVALLFASGE